MHKDQYVRAILPEPAVRFVAGRKAFFHRKLCKGRGMETISDAELKTKIEEISARIDRIVKTISRYSPETDSSEDTDTKEATSEID